MVLILQVDWSAEQSKGFTCLRQVIRVPVSQSLQIDYGINCVETELKPAGFHMSGKS